MFRPMVMPCVLRPGDIVQHMLLLLFRSNSGGCLTLLEQRLNGFLGPSRNHERRPRLGEVGRYPDGRVALGDGIGRRRPGKAVRRRGGRGRRAGARRPTRPGSTACSPRPTYRPDGARRARPRSWSSAAVRSRSRRGGGRSARCGRGGRRAAARPRCRARPAGNGLPTGASRSRPGGSLRLRAWRITSRLT